MPLLLLSPPLFLTSPNFPSLLPFLVNLRLSSLIRQWSTLPLLPSGGLALLGVLLLVRLVRLPLVLRVRRPPLILLRGFVSRVPLRLLLLLSLL